MRAVCIAFVMLAVLVGRADAQPGNTAPGGWQPPPPPVPPTATVPIAGEKSPGLALTLSLGGTLAAYGLAITGGELQNEGLSTIGVLGLYVAPSFGHWYAGKKWTTGLTLRLGGTAAAFLGVMLILGECGFEGDSSCDDSAGAILAIGGAVTVLGGGIYDIATAPGQARTYNAQLRAEAASGWAIAPVVGEDRAALVLSGRF